MSHSPLGSLSSPSPSPSPPPNPIDESELSELTDDDNPPPSARPAPNTKRKKRGGLVPAPMWDWAYKNPSPTPALPGPSRPSPDDDDDDDDDDLQEEEEDLPTPPRAMEEEEAEDPLPRKQRPGKKVPANLDWSMIPRSKRGIKVLAQKTKTSQDALLISLWKQGVKLWDPEAPTSDEDQDPVSRPQSDQDDDEDDDEDDDDDDDDDDDMLVDHSRKPSPASPANDFPSVPPSIRASLDPTVTPPDDDLPRPIQDEDDADPDDDDHNQPPDDDDVHPDEPSQPPSPTPLVDPEPEPDHEDEDPDLQPAHRAEALDVLATIELKFALLRERVYVEKMEGLAWEETLVWDGTHPELHHLQSELTKRRDKRLMLTSKKRSYEIDAISRKRREQESWCWEAWDITRTELQSEMIAETNRKRRKLERERRTVERPPGARRMPTPILNPPPAPTLRQIAHTFPLPSHLSHLAANRKLACAKGLGVYPGLDGLSTSTAYPDLATLSPHEIAADLEFLFQHRRLGYGFGMGFPPIGLPMGVGVGYTSSTPGLAIGFAGPTPIGIASGEPYSNGSGPPLSLGGSGAPPPQSSSVPSQSAIPDGPSFSQPAMGVFQGPPSIGTGPTSYSIGNGGNGTSIVIGPGGTTSTPVMGPGGARIQRPSGFVERERELRERELIHRDRELREREHNPRNRELAAQRETEMRERERERERDFGPNMGPGYPAWNSKPPGGMEWATGDTRRREERERDRDRDRSQIQPIVPTSTHRHLHQHTHPHSHTHPLQQHPAQSPHQPHPVHTHSHQHPHPHGPQHLHQHTQHPHGPSHPPPHHHVGQHHHHRHHHHVVHNHHPVSGSGSADGTSPLPQSSGPAPGVQMEIINLSANPSSKSHWKRDEVKLGGGSRPPSTHPLPPSHSYDERERDRDRDRERDRPIATPFVLAPSHHSISSTASSPRHGWTPIPGESGPSTSSAQFALTPERFHTPVPHRFSNPTPNGLSQFPRPLTTSPPRAPPATSPSTSVNAPLVSSSTGPFPLPRKPSPALPKLGLTPLGYSPRLAGPGVVPPTGPGVPGVLSTGGPGVTPSGILTSGPGVPPGPGIAPAPGGDVMFGSRTDGLIYGMQKVSVDGP